MARRVDRLAENLPSWRARAGASTVEGLLFARLAFLQGATAEDLAQCTCDDHVTALLARLGARFHADLGAGSAGTRTLMGVVEEMRALEDVTADSVARVHQRDLERLNRRRAQGSVYTPQPLIDVLLDAACVDGESVLDPACGTGAFLVRLVARASRPLDALERLSAWDTDERAVHWARLLTLMTLASRLKDGRHAALPDISGHIRVADTLLDCAEETFGLVLGNPPYVDSETMTQADPSNRAEIAMRYSVARGNWDLFCVFIERAVQLCRPGGRVALVVPNTLLSAGYARSVRKLLAAKTQVKMVWDCSRSGLFDASVYPVAFVATCGAVHGPTVVRAFPDGPVTTETWPTDGSAWACGAGALVRDWSRFPTLAQVADVRGAATVAEAYLLKPLLQEMDHSEHLKFVNSGTIAQGQLLWGNRRCRYLGRSLLRPVVSPDALRTLFPRRWEQARQPKIMVSGMSRALTCALDPDGAFLAGKSTSVVTSTTVDLRVLLAVLHSRPVQAWVQESLQGNRMRGGYVRMGPPQLRAVPVALPPGNGLATLTDLLHNGKAAQAQALIEEAYGWQDQPAS